MQPATSERRAPDATRVPLDLWIRLAHEDFEDCFDADGVDLSTGGVALRADYLPEVGDRLRCHFDAPAGEALAIDGEVVWAHDAGERSGEFGLRFGALDGRARAHLDELVRTLGDDPSPARLHLDGVASALEGEVVDRDVGWVTVEQELTFLHLGMGVTVEDQGGTPRGELASVDVRVVDGIPRLVLSVELEDRGGRGGPSAEPPGVALPSEDTFDDAGQLEAGTAQTLEEIDDRTMRDEPGWPRARQESAETSPAERDDELADRAYGYGPGDSFVDEPYERDRADEVRRFVIEAADEDDERAGESTARPRDAVAMAERAEAVRERLIPVLARARAGISALGKAAGPAAWGLWAKLALLFGALRKATAPKFAGALARAKSFAIKLLARKSKRRTTAAPPRRVAGAPRRRQQSVEPAAPRRTGRRALVLGALAVGSVAAAVYAFTAGDGAVDEPSPRPLAGVEDAPAPLPAPARTPAPQATPTPEAAQPDPEPEPEGGQLGTPSFPTLSDADPASAPITEGATFGAASVPDGRSATIRMSQPVSTLRGQPTDSGFTVTVPGALALDRAGPIAAANPSVERAMILNRGDHAVLTVRFVAGREPAYRVAARGRAIEIIIGR